MAKVSLRLRTRGIVWSSASIISPGSSSDLIDLFNVSRITRGRSSSSSSSSSFVHSQALIGLYSAIHCETDTSKVNTIQMGKYARKELQTILNEKYIKRMQKESLRRPLFNDFRPSATAALEKCLNKLRWNYKKISDNKWHWMNRFAKYASKLWRYYNRGVPIKPRLRSLSDRSLLFSWATSSVDRCWTTRRRRNPFALGWGSALQRIVLVRKFIIKDLHTSAASC